MLALPMPLDGAAEPFLEPPQPVGLALALPLADMAHALFECRQHGLLAPHQTGRPSEARGATVQPLRLHVQVAPGGIRSASARPSSSSSPWLRGCAHSSAAAVGVGARRSATKSAMVKSVS